MTWLVASLLLSLTAQNAPAQQPAPAAPAPPAGQAPAASPGQKAEPYVYSPDGRRDPFLSLVGGGSTEVRATKRGEGPAGLSVGDISVRGVLQSRGALVAMIEGPDKKTYIVHQGDKFVDGTIKSITTTGLVVVQEVNDPLSIVKQREIIKSLRSLENRKE
jgi:type IV pilus assembly protein PilP